MIIPDFAKMSTCREMLSAVSHNVNGNIHASIIDVVGFKGRETAQPHNRCVLTGSLFTY